MQSLLYPFFAHCIINYLLLLVRAAFAGDLQSISWSTMALGGICGSLFGGYALSNFQIYTIFLLYSMLPTIQLLSCCFVDENTVNSKVLLENSTVRDSHSNDSTPDKDNSLAKNTRSTTTRRKKGKKNSKRRAVNGSRLNGFEKRDTLALKWYHSLREAAYDLCRTFRKPMILR